MTTKTQTRSLIAALATLPLLALTSNAAVISWTSGTITGDSNVDTTGFLVEAANFAGSDVSVNTVTFSGVDFANGGSPTNLIGLNYDIHTGGGTSTGGSIDTLTGTNAYENFVNTQTADLTGLTDGSDYLVQFFVAHSTTTRATTIDDGNGNTATISHTGEFATGTFTAVGTTQSLIFNNPDGSQLLGGYQLRAVPEPSTLILIGLAGLGVLARRRRV